MFHRETLKKLIDKPIHELLFYVFLFLLPIQTRVIYNSQSAYIGSTFNYHLAIIFYLTDLLLFTCFVSWILFNKPWQDIEKRNLTLYWLILGFFGWILVSLFHVKHRGLGLYEMAKWLELVLLLLYVCETMINRAKFRFILITLFLSALIQAVLALLQFHVQHSLGLKLLGEYIAPLETPGLATVSYGTQKVVRAYGTFPHPNILGAFLILCFIFGLWLLYESNNYKSKVWVSCGTIVIILGIFVTFSRLTWFSATLAMLCFMIYSIWKKDKKILIILSIISLVSCGTILLTSSNMLKARISESDQSSINDRRLFNNFGLNLLKQHPWLGVGVGNYVPALREAKPNLLTWQYQPAHNIFIFMGAELGLIGLGLFIVILTLIFWRMRHVSYGTLEFGFLMPGVLFLLMGQFDHYFVTIQQGRLMFFLVLGLIAALPNIYQERS